jgi:PAS domain S-box-containing protein
MPTGSNWVDRLGFPSLREYSTNITPDCLLYGVEAYGIGRQQRTGGILDVIANGPLMHYRAEVQRRIVTRFPAACAVLVACATCATILEVLRFPERRAWMLASDATFLVIAAGALTLLRAVPQRSVGIAIAAVNVLGLILNAYHAIVGAQPAMCIWTLTALLASSALLLQWGWRAQALASIGAVIGYSLLLRGDESAVLTWVAGGVYLGWVAGLSALGAELIDRYLASQLELASTLSERESRLRSYFDLSLVGTVILSRDRTLLEVNEELCRILGYRPEELLRVTWADLVPPGDRGADLALFTSVLGGERPAASREGELLRRDGAPIHASISVRALPGPLGQADHLIVVVQDMTERKQLEEAARQHEAKLAQAARLSSVGQMALEIAHELNQPLGAIANFANGCVRHLKSNTGNTADLIDTIEQIAGQAVRAGGIMRRIMSGARKPATSPECVQLNDLVHDVARLVGAEMQRFGITLRLDLAPQLPMVQIDRLQIEEAVVNLIRNGCEAMQGCAGARQLFITTSMASPSVVEVAVRDTGRGLPPEIAARIFEPFYTTKPESLGLGLSISRSIVEAHGGDLHARGENGGGTTFWFTLPAAEVDGRMIHGGQCTA